MGFKPRGGFGGDRGGFRGGARGGFGGDRGGFRGGDRGGCKFNSCLNVLISPWWIQRSKHWWFQRQRWILIELTTVKLTHYLS